MDNIQLNERNQVVSVGEVRLDEPMELQQYVEIMRKVRAAVDIYFEMVMKADKGLVEFLAGDTVAAELAHKFKDQLIAEISKKRRVKIYNFTPQTGETHVTPDYLPENDEESWQERNPAKKSALDLHIEYRNMTSSRDVVSDALTQQIVAICEEHILMEFPGAEMRLPENRHAIRFTTEEFWKAIKKQFEGVEEALDPRYEKELPAILIESGWKVIGKARHTEHLYLLPFGRSVPGCHWAKRTEDDHPFWTRTLR